VNIFVETQPIFNIEVSLASYYNSLSEYVQKCRYSFNCTTTRGKNHKQIKYYELFLYFRHLLEHTKLSSQTFL